MFCDKHFDQQCEKHYLSLRSASPLTTVGCPYGFVSLPFNLGNLPFAATGLVLYPRLGGAQERARAKAFPASRLSTQTVLGWVERASAILLELQAAERHSLNANLEAVHEVRRINQTIKIVMERICVARSTGGDPERADPDLVRAWKGSELISAHLDALDILANPTLRAAPPDREVVFFKIVDKVHRIYLPRADEKQLRLQLSGSSVRKARVHTGTIHVAPSAFVDNAIKYAPRGSRVAVHVYEGVKNNIPIVGFDVTSFGPAATPEEKSRLFLQRGRGVAARAQAEGSGVGLVLVKMVADQHRAHVAASQRAGLDGLAEWSFSFEIPVCD